MFHSILTVCTGNICRSPMAEALLREGLAARGEVRVASAGIGAMASLPADPRAQEVMHDRGIDLSAHRSRQLDESLLFDHDLVLVMETYQAQWISSRFPTARGRVFLLGHWRGGQEVTDPYGRTREAFEEVLKVLDDYVEDWLKRMEIIAPSQ